MQFTQYIAAAVMATLVSTAVATPHPNRIMRRNCPRVTIDASQQICEELLGVGNNESRKCQRLMEEIAAQNCLCTNGTVLYDAASDNANGHAYCSSTGPCWF